MIVILNRNFKNFKGEEGSRDMKETICECLYSCGEGLTIEEKFQAYKLNFKLIPSFGRVELSAEEAALIKKVCGRFLTAGTYGQIVDLIEGSGQSLVTEANTPKSQA